MKAQTFYTLREKARQVDWPLLVFIVLVLNVKLVVKLAGILFIYLARRNVSFRFALRPPRIPVFYPAMIAIALIDFFAYALYGKDNYPVLLLTGTGFWIICILVFHQVSLAVERASVDVLHNTVFVFFLLNILFSLTAFLSIVIETGALNPYRYQGMYQKYFIGTGDYIRGISFDTSTTNAILNAFGMVYFLSRRQMPMSLLCMIVLLMTSSNFTNLLIIACLLLVFLVKSSRVQKSIIVVHLALLVAFLVNISPQNNDYAINIAGKALGKKLMVKHADAKPIPVTQLPDSVLTPDQRKEKAARNYLDSNALVQQRAGDTAVRQPVLTIPKVNIYAPEYERKADSSAARLQAIGFIQKMAADSAVLSKKVDTAVAKRSAGKLIAFQQLLQFMREHPARIATGNGMGNFSSKLAFRATGLKLAGGYPASLVYIDDDFKENHLAVYLNYFARDAGYHSIVHSPNSVYAQLAGEYGVAGIICFLAGYAWYFIRRWRRLSYGLPVLFIMAGAFVAEYWFEQLSVVVIFEWLLLLDLKENTPQPL